jgi:hypothetical protein
VSTVIVPVPGQRGPLAGVCAGVQPGTGPAPELTGPGIKRGQMSTSYPRFTARIEGPPEIIFDLIADMPNYGRWLPGSEAFGRDNRGIALSCPPRHNLS